VRPDGVRGADTPQVPARGRAPGNPVACGRWRSGGWPQLPAMVGLAALWAVFEVGYYATYVWCVGRLKRVPSKVNVRKRLEQVSGGVLVALRIRLAFEG
jgi:hypothetical protein